MTFQVANHIEWVRDVASGLPDEDLRDLYFEERDENEPPELEDDDEWYPPDVSDETPEDARMIRAMFARRYWMAHQ